MNTHAHNWTELPVLPKKRWETGNRHTKPISKQNSTHTYMHELMRTQTLERLLEVTWLLANVENNGPMNILTFWWWSRSSLSNWGVKARSAQQLFATLFATLSLCRFLSEFWLQQMLYTFCYNSITSCASIGWKWRGVPIQHEELRMEKKLSIAANSWIITSADETRQQNRHFYRTAAASDFKVRTPERARGLCFRRGSRWRVARRRVAEHGVNENAFDQFHNLALSLSPPHFLVCLYLPPSLPPSNRALINNVHFIP